MTDIGTEAPAGTRLPIVPASEGSSKAVPSTAHGNGGPSQAGGGNGSGFVPAKVGSAIGARTTVRRVRVYTRLSAELRDRLSGYCEASGIAEREVFEAALAQYLDSTNDLSLVLRRLDRLGRTGARTHRELELLSETFAVFMRLWFAHTPSLTEEEKPAARKDAESRYGQFVEHIGAQFAGGHRYLDDLPREVLGDDTELDAIPSGTFDSDHGDGEKKKKTMLASAGSSP